MAETLEPTDTRAGWICWVRPRDRTAAASLALVLTLVSVNGLHSAARGQSVPAVTRSNESPRPTPSMSTPRAGATQDTGSPQDMPGDTRSAQALFEQGLKRAQDGRWAAARDNFRRAYMIVPRPALLFNLAGAQARSGNMLAAHANYQRLLQGSYPEIGPAH